MVSLFLQTLLAAMLVSVMPSTKAIPTTVTSSSSSSSSQGATYINGQQVGGHCEASKNGYSSGCQDPNFNAIPDTITTVTPGDFMPFGFPPLPNMDNFANNFQFPNFANGFPFNNFPDFSFPPFNPISSFNNNFNAPGSWNNPAGFNGAGSPNPGPPKPQSPKPASPKN
ncbi:hypothetical protein PGT21_028636 [Puccinia graminis f. sp. tritici]|uniref:Secreted protein n=1 Tax=Puccinia graminis f. sp. tritici TaxID=56615 RepID=A0A5B0PMD2_PUCGR|nr:hypothetical protein PGT21_029358 [Puccinia graminis f. sp. tritici]KAA1101728.1 hypothetical protein PGT21_028636 [Puccinia graminis f. sp. tritici]KAA1116890.1 hypothetical protein PGTUg99_028968 [Puccinia graminis f. sp. tritici]